MHIGIYTARGADYYPNRRLSEAAFCLGHRVSLIHPKRCIQAIYDSRLDMEILWDRGPVDVLLPRIGATINEYALTVVRHFELMSIPVVNGFQSIMLAKNKFLGHQSMVHGKIPSPETYFVSNPSNFEKAVEKLGGYPVVVKTPSARQGKGVVLLKDEATAGFVVHHLEIRNHGLLVQEYIAPEKRRDIRVFTLGDRIVAAMELRPRGGDFRTNIHLRSEARKINLTKELEALVHRTTGALGLEISGTDILIDQNGRPRVVEVNYAPGFKGLEATTGIDVATEVIKYVARRGLEGAA